MKKVFLAIAIVGAFAFSKPDVSLNSELFPDCGEHGRFWMTACSSGCLTYIQNGVQRLPSDSEFNNYRNLQEENCNALFPNSPNPTIEP